MLSRRHQQWYNNTLQMARAHNSTGRYNMVALLVKGNRVITAGYNQYPKRRRNRDFSYIGLHAEMHVLLRTADKNATLYIAGTNFNKKEICSKPCRYCIELIKERQIRTIVYRDEDNNLILVHYSNL